MATTKYGYAVLTAATEQFINSCPAIIDYSTDPNSREHCTFRFDETVDVTGPIPAGVWFERDGLQFARIASDHESADFAGWYGDNDVPFRVQIRENAAPDWYDSPIDDDAKLAILDAIDSL